MGKQAIRSLALGAACVLVAARALAFTPPRDGGRLPDSFFDARAKNPLAFTIQRGWVQKAQRLRAEREALMAQPGGVSAFQLQGLAVSDTLRAAVLPGYFSNESAVPVSAATLQAQLFTSNATGTITDYYREVSYDQLTMTGTVFSWAKVSKNASYYYGTCNGVGTGCSYTGEFIKEVLDLKDASVDFAQYDNDGSDGVPNSGDDDGFVDAAVFVHSLAGGECGGSTFISHTWSYSAWPNSGGLPYTTNDSRAGGGFIQIDEYVLAPAGNCGAVTPYSGADEVIDIGVYCHELGHVLGLPDLYDVDGGGNGIGHWGVMGSGNWNTKEKPAHMDAWCKYELGWVLPTVIGWQPSTVNIPEVETNAVVYKLPFHDERFRRSTSCVITGAYSLYCGLTAAEAATRAYANPGTGYGPNWYQTIERDFHYSGTGGVTLQYQFTYDTEPSYDFGQTLIEVNGTELVVAEYNGTGSGSANIALGPFLAALAGAGGDYTLKFRVISDLSFDDADGNDPSTCGAFVVDNVSVNGGGVAYSTGFESSVDGWHVDESETRSDEYWLVENRRRTGFDVNLHGEGLLVWHVDGEVVHAPFLGNRGTGGAPRGLVVEEAEGVFDLNGGGANTGEAADVYPGTSGNTSFTSATTPNSNDNLGRPTQIEITSVSPAGAAMSAMMKAGDPAPLATSILPTSIDNDQPATLVTVSGSRIRYGATFKFTIPETEIQATGLEWVDASTLRGTVNVYARTPGQWDLVVTNPDGQTVTLDNALTVNPILAARVVSASIDVGDDEVRLRYVLLERDADETIRLYRANGTGVDFRLISERLEPAHGDEYAYVDREVEPGRSYTYLLESRTADGEVRELHRGVAVVPARELVLEQNIPNPFNPRTSIRFYLPTRTRVRLDVYDVRGALVRRLAEGSYDAGPHAVEWDGTDRSGNGVASGFYVYRLVTDGRALSRKMLLLK
jgi:M6 family metalloprotease-like protein